MTTEAPTRITMEGIKASPDYIMFIARYNGQPAVLEEIDKLFAALGQSPEAFDTEVDALEYRDMKSPLFKADLFTVNGIGAIRHMFEGEPLELNRQKGRGVSDRSGIK